MPGPKFESKVIGRLKISPHWICQLGNDIYALNHHRFQENAILVWGTPILLTTRSLRKTNDLFTEIEKNSTCEMEMVAIAAIFIAIAAAAMAPRRRGKIFAV